MSYNLHKEKVLYVCSRMNNITKIGFEEGLSIVQHTKQFCKEQNLHLDGLWSPVGEDVQKRIREYFLTQVSFKLTKSDYFALFALLIGNGATCWEDVMEDVDRCEFHAHISYQCCCSQPIQHIYRITNKHTKLSLCVGSECIKKYGIENLKESLKEATRVESKRKKYRLCEDCEEYVIRDYEPLWKKRCLDCWKKNVWLLN